MVDNPRPAATSLSITGSDAGQDGIPLQNLRGSLGERVLRSTGISTMLSQCLYASPLSPNGLECGVNLVSDKFL